MAVIFSAVGTSDSEGYEPTLKAMRELAQMQPGFLGIESAGGGAAKLEVTVSYWRPRLTPEYGRPWRNTRRLSASDASVGTSPTECE